MPDKAPVSSVLAACKKFQEIPIAVERTSRAAFAQGCQCLSREPTGAAFTMKQTTISIETTSLLILRAGNSRTAWCPACGAEVEMLEISTRGISALGQLPREVHRSEAAGGAALICLNSLLLACRRPNQPANCGSPRLPNTEKEKI